MLKDSKELERSSFSEGHMPSVDLINKWVDALEKREFKKELNVVL